MNGFSKAVALVAFTLLSAVAGCSSSGKKEKFAYVEKPVEQLYAQATRAMERRRYDEAIAYFEEVERQHPYSAWARRAMLMKAYAYYQGNDYEEAIGALDQFVSLHPGNKDAPYAYYLKAMSYYERIRDVGRDQNFTANAVQSLNDVVRRYPGTEYARDARLKLDLTFDHLAAKEMYVGRFYMRAGKHIAAINRFKRVITQYQTTSHAPEAMARLVEANLEIGLVGEARAAAAVLGHNYPGTEWYEHAYRLMDRNNVLEPGTQLARNEKRLKKSKKKEKKADERVEEGNVDLEAPSGAVDLIDKDGGDIDNTAPPDGR